MLHTPLLHALLFLLLGCPLRKQGNGPIDSTAEGTSTNGRCCGQGWKLAYISKKSTLAPRAVKCCLCQFAAKISKLASCQGRRADVNLSGTCFTWAFFPPTKLALAALEVQLFASVKR